MSQERCIHDSAYTGCGYLHGGRWSTSQCLCGRIAVPWGAFHPDGKIETDDDDDLASLTVDDPESVRVDRVNGDGWQIVVVLGTGDRIVVDLVGRSHIRGIAAREAA